MKELYIERLKRYKEQIINNNRKLSGYLENFHGDSGLLELSRTRYKISNQMLKHQRKYIVKKVLSFCLACSLLGGAAHYGGQTISKKSSTHQVYESVVTTYFKNGKYSVEIEKDENVRENSMYMVYYGSVEKDFYSYHVAYNVYDLSRFYNELDVETCFNLDLFNSRIVPMKDSIRFWEEEELQSYDFTPKLIVIEQNPVKVSDFNESEYLLKCMLFYVAYILLMFGIDSKIKIEKLGVDVKQYVAFKELFRLKNIELENIINDCYGLIRFNEELQKEFMKLYNEKEYLCGDSEELYQEVKALFEKSAVLSKKLNS